MSWSDKSIPRAYVGWTSLLGPQGLRDGGFRPAMWRQTGPVRDEPWAMVTPEEIAAWTAEHPECRGTERTRAALCWMEREFAAITKGAAA